MKRRDVYLKLTRHNGRAGAHGTYNPKHNDRSFNLANSEHIDPERVKGNMRMIEDTKKWVLSPERKAPQATREYAAHRLDTVLDKFLKTMQSTAAHLQEKLLKPEARQKGKEQVKEKARDSVLQLLSRLQAEQAQRKLEEPHTAEKPENRFQ